MTDNQIQRHLKGLRESRTDIRYTVPTHRDGRVLCGWCEPTDWQGWGQAIWNEEKKLTDPAAEAMKCAECGEVIWKSMNGQTVVLRREEGGVWK